MIASDHAEAKHVTFIIKDLKPLCARSGGEAGYHVDFAEGSHVTVPDYNVATLEEIFVSLRVIESANQGPSRLDWGFDKLNHRGTTLVRSKGVYVVQRDRVR